MPQTTENDQRFIDLNDYNEFKTEVQSLIYLKEGFRPVIYKIIKKSITP